MVKANFFIIMEMFIKDNIKMILSKDLAYLYGKMGKHFEVLG